MTARSVLKMGDPRLYQVAGSVAAGELGSEALRELVADMFDTMAAYSGAGLAAPQIGVSKRVVIFGVTANPRYPDAEPVPTTVLINPRIDVLSSETEGAWEGCLSVPGMRGYVERATRIRYRGVDAEGQAIDREVHGFHARVVQHEVDHLDGILYPMRLEDIRRLGFEDAMFPKDEI
jgi:peptide deformylase